MYIFLNNSLFGHSIDHCSVTMLLMQHFTNCFYDHSLSLNDVLKTFLTTTSSLVTRSDPKKTTILGIYLKSSILQTSITPPDYC